LAGIVLSVAIPAGLLSTFAIDPSTDSSLSAYVALMQLALNAAILYAVVAVVEGRPVTIRQAYYEGSGLLIRLVLLTLLLLVLALPLLLALLITAYGVVAPGATLGLMEKVLVGGLAVAVALPGLVLLTRSLWAVLVIADSPAGPMQAVRLSWQLTQGRTWAALGRLLALALMLGLLLVVPVSGLSFLSAISGSVWPYLLLQLILALVALPLSALYLHGYYRSLKA
jgi:hypothetical protein